MKKALLLNIMDPSKVDTERIFDLRCEISSLEATLCSERARFYTKIFSENQDKPYIIRKALAFAYTLRNMSLYVLENSSIVGNIASKPFAAPIYFEYSVDWIVNEIDSFSLRNGDAFNVDESVKSDILHAANFWKGNTHQDNVKRNLSEEVKKASEIHVLHLGGISMSGDGHIVPDYSMILKKGFKVLIEEIRLSLLKELSKDQKYFYEAAVITLEAALDYFKRYGLYLKDLARQEQECIKKEKLLKMSYLLENLLEKPASSYWEATQVVFMVHVLQMIESNGHSFCFGRFDQYMIEYYHNDINEGVLTQEQALEITTDFFLMTNTLNKIRPNNHTKFSQGYPLYSNLMVSGMNAQHEDVSNELTFLCIEAMNLTALPHPNFSLRYHRKTPDAVLYAAVKLIKEGFGMPSLFNDHVVIEGLLNLGIDKEDAYDYCAIGCVETGIPGKYGHRATGMTYLNWGKLIELLINNGTDPNTGTTMLKVDPSQDQNIEFSSFEQMHQGYRLLLEYYTNLAVESDLICDQSLKIYDTSPFASCFIDHCLSLGKTIKEGGCKYDVISQSNIGSSVVGNSLYTYKHLVFEKRKYSCREILDGINDNWQSNKSKQIHKDIMALPKFGNDIDEVDECVRMIFEDYLELLPMFTTDRKNKGPKISCYTMSTSNITSYVPNGLEVNATPDGRFAYEPLNEGCSPTQGTDVSGPTAVIKSVSKLPNTKVAAGQLLNMRFAPSVFDNESTLRKFLAFLRTCIELNVYHNQFNVIDVQTLKDAQANPRNYSDLIVRVAGYCAKFISLSPEAQNAIIARSQNDL